MGNEGGRPGGLRRPDACGCRSRWANYLGLLPETGKDPRRFSNFVEFLPETGRNPTEFGRPPAKVFRNTAGL
jgi:hypothetical protein